VLLAAIVCGSLGLWSAPAMGLQPPHDASNGIVCSDCHKPHGNGQLVAFGAAQEAVCKSCHNPSGQAKNMHEIANHVVGANKTVVDCGSCHNPHGPSLSTDTHPNGVTATNLKLIRNDIAKYLTGALEPAVFQSKPAHFAFAEANPPYNGICQACHSQTDHHTRDGSGDHNHNTGLDCTSCHPHEDGFAPTGGCTICHATTQGPRRQIVDAGGDFALSSHHVVGTPTDDDCSACHFMGGHQSGTVMLKDPDLGGGLIYSYDPLNPDTIEPFCLNCHDSDGAQHLDVPLQPFSDGQAPPNIAASGTWAAASHSGGKATCMGDGSSTGCHGNAHGSDNTKLLSAAAGVPIEQLCGNCHTGGSHVAGKTFTVAQKTFSLQCTTCHNPHMVSGGSADAGNGKTPITMPDLTADPLVNPRAMGTTLWGDNSGEKMADYAAAGTYRTPNGDSLTGAELPDYVSFCLACHGPMEGKHGGVTWSNDPHGLNSANVPNGGGACPDWYGCGKASGWDGDDCVKDEATCWPVMTRGKGDQIFTRGPYDHAERIGGANFVLACPDCHISHGSGIGYKLRTSVNDGPGSVIWNTMCNNCHYYYSDWHAGMSCGPSSCHVNSRLPGTGSLHGLSNMIGSSATRSFDPTLVANLQFSKNLNDSGDWRLHSRWFDTAGTFVSGQSGYGIALDGDQVIELGTRNSYWSTDEGRHGTWKYTSMKYNTTLEAWVYPTALPSGGDGFVVLTKNNLDGNYELRLQGLSEAVNAAFVVNVNGGGVANYWDADCNGLRGAYSSVGLPLNQWSHIAGMFDTNLPDRDPNDLSVGRVRVYVNGEDVTTSNPYVSGECFSEPDAGEDWIFPYSLHSSNDPSRCYLGHWCAQPFAIGGRMWNSGSRSGLKGRLDGVKVWNISKSASDYDAIIGPLFTRAEGVAGSTTLTVRFNEGVYANQGQVGNLVAADLKLVGSANSISGVTHVAGQAQAIIQLSQPLAAGDIDSASVGVNTNSVFDDYDNAQASSNTIVITGAECPTGPTTIDLNEAAASTTITDTQGVLDGTVNDPAASMLGDGYFHGDGVDNYIELANPTCFRATTKLTLESRFKPTVVDDGNTTTIQRIFAKNGTGNYQLSVWRNENWATYNAPDAVASLAFWLRPLDPHGGKNWKLVITDYSICPIVANHWYQAKVVWDSSLQGVIPGSILVDDLGTDGAGAGELWVGSADCTDYQQVLIASDQQLLPGDQIYPSAQTMTIGANPGNYKKPFNGLIDWVYISLN